MAQPVTRAMQGLTLYDQEELPPLGEQRWAVQREEPPRDAATASPLAGRVSTLSQLAQEALKNADGNRA